MSQLARADREDVAESWSLSNSNEHGESAIPTGCRWHLVAFKLNSAASHGTTSAGFRQSAALTGEKGELSPTRGNRSILLLEDAEKKNKKREKNDGEDDDEEKRSERRI